MKRFIFISAIFLVSILLSQTSCARMEKVGPRYDKTQCPFCTLQPGVCNYCQGTKKCTFCNGTGKRHTVIPSLEYEDIKKAAYNETCPYCKGSGVCRYCEGSGKCWACDGKGIIDSWAFFEKYEASKEEK